MTPKIFTTGGMIIDNVVTSDGALARGQIGGNAVYSAAGAGLWLDAVGLCARIPENYPADKRAALSAAGLGPDGITVEPVDVDLEEWFFYRDDGERRDHLHASRSEADAFGMTGGRVSERAVEAFARFLAGRAPHDLDYAQFRLAHPVQPAHVPATFWEARGVHLAPNRPDAMLDLARAARAKGLLATCDPGSHARSMDSAFLRELLPLVDGFFPSRREIALLFPGRAVEAALLDLAAQTRVVAGVKLGDQGSLVALRGGSHCEQIPACVVAARDLNGAGDAYCGGFIAGLALSEPPLVAARRATVAASFAVETQGPLPLLAISRAAAEARLHAFDEAPASGYRANSKS